MRTSNRLKAIADALRPVLATAKALEVDLARTAPDGVTWAMVEKVRIDLASAVESLDGEVTILRGGGRGGRD